MNEHSYQVFLAMVALNHYDDFYFYFFNDPVLLDFLYDHIPAQL